MELGGLRTQAELDVAQVLPVRELRESHAQELVEAAERAHVEVAVVLGCQPAKGMPRRELHHPGEHEPAGVHLSLPDKFRKSAKTPVQRSSRLHPRKSWKPSQS